MTNVQYKDNVINGVLYVFIHLIEFRNMKININNMTNAMSGVYYALDQNHRLYMVYKNRLRIPII